MNIKAPCATEKNESERRTFSRLVHELALQPGETDGVKSAVLPMLNLLQEAVLGTKWELWPLTLTPRTVLTSSAPNPSTFSVWADHHSQAKPIWSQWPSRGWSGDRSWSEETERLGRERKGKQLWKHLGKVQLRMCPFRWHKCTSYRGLMKCKMMELNCWASAFGQNGLTFENSNSEKLGFPLEMHLCLEKFSRVLTWTWPWLTCLTCSPLHCFARKNIRAASQFEHCSSQLQADLCLASQLSAPAVRYLFCISCFLCFLSLPSSTQEIHVIFLTFSVPGIHSQSSRSGWIIHWNNYH